MGVHKVANAMKNKIKTFLFAIGRGIGMPWAEAPIQPMYTSRYRYFHVGDKITVKRLSDGATCILAQEAKEAFLEKVFDIQELWKEYSGKPFGDWTCVEEHLDGLMDIFEPLYRHPDKLIQGVSYQG